MRAWHPLRPHWKTPEPTNTFNPPQECDTVFISAGGHKRDSGINAIETRAADLVAYGRWCVALLGKGVVCERQRGRTLLAAAGPHTPYTRVCINPRLVPAAPAHEAGRP